MLKIPKSTIGRHIQRLGLVKKLDIWIIHELKEIHLRGGSTLQRENQAYFLEMNCEGSTKDINTIFFLFKDTSFHFKSVFLQIFKHELRDLGTSLNLSLPKFFATSNLFK